MIIDSIKNADKYYSVHPSFAAAFEALKAIDENTPDERITVDGDNIFINLSTYENKHVSNCLYESHKKYIDIQYVINGAERIDLTDVKNLEVTEDRLETDDIAFYKDCEYFSSAHLGEGIFVVIFPEEAHKPMIAPDGKGIKTRKAVAKIIY